MLDKSQIEAASRTLRDHWRDGTKLAALETVASPFRPPGSLRDPGGARKSFRPETCSAGKSPPPARPGRSTSMSMARWRGASCHQTVLPDGGTASMTGNEMRVAEPEFAFRMARDLPPRSSALFRAADSRCGRHVAPGDRDSRFAVCGFRQRGCCANHRGQCLRAFVRSRGAAPPRTGARSIWSRRNRSLCCAEGNSPGMARTCSATPGSR